ncbi:ABC transporter substrate-binding protein [Luteimicrobium subarcticum]|uniref:Putative aliphatic sulfonates-binding protein n=1 Tax=Luteimicrobium subarcticum TaxID=620910 RepID=A0A2M8WVK2_9MICO|nr:ABC transporter substrate-binding protein [Luteimicrobium subarcticum]PJI94954.1 sulfonate transport system substrate-binding protein [Luteimicrobium subarcticum]
MTRPVRRPQHAPRTRRLVRTLAATTALAAAAALSACSGSSEATTPGDPSTVTSTDLAGLTLQVGDQKAGTQALLQAAGELDGTPYKIAFSTFTSGPPEVEALNANKIDFAITGNTPPVFGLAAKAKIKVVTAYTNDASSDAILLPAGSSVTSVADLKGKKVAVAKGSSANGHLLLQLSKAGLTPDDVTISYLQPADALAAFNGGEVDAWAIWDPYTAIAEQQGAKVLVTAQGVSNGYGLGLASYDALADPVRTAALQDLAQRIARAHEWANTHPDEYAAVYAEQTQLPIEVAKEANRSLRHAILLDDTVVSSEQRLTDAFVTAKQLPASDPFSSIVDDRLNASVAAALAPGGASASPTPTAP